MFWSLGSGFCISALAESAWTTLGPKPRCRKRLGHFGKIHTALLATTRVPCVGKVLCRRGGRKRRGGEDAGLEFRICLDLL